MKTLNTSKYDNELWIADSNTSVNLREDLFTCGVLLIKERGVKVPNCEKGTFKLSSRELRITNRKQLRPINIEKSMKLLASIFNLSHCISVPKESNVISNKERREEIFFPVINTSNNINFYAYPWISKKYELPDTFPDTFNGFTRYASALCMFGSNLKGYDNHNTAMVLIKHGIQFHAGQRIEGMNLDQEGFNFYEEVLKFELKRLGSFVAETNRKEAEKIAINIHLPHYDYLLFAIDLLLNGKLSKLALTQFAEIMTEGVPRYEQLIKKEFCDARYDVSVCSPFSSLFGDLIHTAKDSSDLLFEMFNIIKVELDSEINFSPEGKQRLTDKIIKSLYANVCDSNSEQKLIWKSLIDCKGTENIKCLEDVLQLGNTIIPMTTGFGTEEFDTCSILPVTEKQIQVSHEYYYHRLNHPAIFYFTFLDSVIGHNFSVGNAPSSAVSAFYFNSQNSGNLKKLLQKGDILMQVSKNVKTSSRIEGEKTNKQNLGENQKELTLKNNGFKFFKEKPEAMTTPVSISPPSIS